MRGILSPYYPLNAQKLPRNIPQTHISPDISCKMTSSFSNVAPKMPNFLFWVFYGLYTKSSKTKITTFFHLPLVKGA